MKKLFTILLFLLSFLGYSQGDGYLNYKAYRVQGGNNSTWYNNGTTYGGHVNDETEFNAIYDTSSTLANGSSAVTLLGQGVVLANSTQGVAGGHPPYTNGTSGHVGGEHFVVEYTGWFYARSTGQYFFYNYADDSSETWIDGVKIAAKYGGSGTASGWTTTLTGGQWYSYMFRYHEHTGGDYGYNQIFSSMHSGYYYPGDGSTESGQGVYKVSSTEPEPTFANTVSDGQNAVYYKVFSINGGDGTVGSHHPDNASQFTTLFDYQNTAGTTWTHQGRDTATKALTWPFPNTLPRPNNGLWFGWEITGYFVPEETGTYEFKTSSDDRSDLFMDTDLDGTLDQIVYYYEGPSRYTYEVSLTAGEEYPFRVRYENGNGGANLYITWKRPSDSNYQFNSDEIWSVKPADVPLHYDVNYKFRNIDETAFSLNTYYQATENSWIQNSNSNTITLDANGEATITSQIDEDLVGTGKYNITATPGSVEWIVVYAPIVTNKYKYRIGLDVREFPNGVGLNDINNIELLDLVDTDGTSTFDGNTYNNYWESTTSDSYWNNINYYTWNAIPWSSSNYSSNIRAMNYGNYAIKAELNFNAVQGYKTQSVIFNSPSTTQLETLIDDYFTVADVVLAFNELAGGGINGGLKGDFNYNVQYANADLSRDGVFDFKDTQLMLDFLNGGTDFDASYLAAVMSLTEVSEYESMTSTNWTNYGTTRTQFPLGLSTGTKTYDKSIAVHWKGDVNMSHSHLPSAFQVTSMAMKNMTINHSSSQKSTDIEVGLDIQKVGEEIVVTLNIPQNGSGVVGSEFRIGYDNSRVVFDRIENTSQLHSFSAKRSNYIKLGSISTDGSLNLNGGTEYKIYFKETNNLSSFLGLVSVLKSELVDKDGNQIGVTVK